MIRFFKPAPAESMGLITNYRCTFRCRHCLYCSSPDIEESVDEEALHEILRQIDGVLGPVLLHIGGGEPLLHFNMVKGIISRIQETRIILEYIETNGSLLLKKTESRLKELKDAGLNRVLMSISPFHNEFIPVGRVKEILRAIVALFGRGGLFPWHPGYLEYLEQASENRAVSLDDYFRLFSPQTVRGQLTSIMYIHPMGRAARLMADHLPLYPPRDLMEHDCAVHLASPVHAHVDHEGNYLTGFCGGLRIGRRTGFDLDGMYARGVNLDRLPILDALVNRGLKGLVQMGREAGWTPRDRGYVSPCHLCLDLRLHLYKDDNTYEELHPRFFYEELR
ncbi:MAG: radical SAM protein [Desulfobacterales bacterium]|nr:radical SAM protein [Desulfobacterales bacterium]